MFVDALKGYNRSEQNKPLVMDLREHALGRKSNAHAELVISILGRLVAGCMRVGANCVLINSSVLKALADKKAGCEFAF